MSADDPKDLEEEFWDNVAAYDSEEPRPLSTVLTETGVTLPAPEELDDTRIAAKLWELINKLALLGTFLHNTNHLSDRELYETLWREELREPAVLLPGNASYSYHIDMVGSGSEEHMHLYMKYYAAEDERRSWLKEWPKDELPEHEDPPHDRDRRLPRSEDMKDGPVM